MENAWLARDARVKKSVQKLVEKQTQKIPTILPKSYVSRTGWGKSVILLKHKCIYHISIPVCLSNMFLS